MIGILLLWCMVTVALLSCLVYYSVKIRLAKKIIARLLTDDVFYHETRGRMIDRNCVRGRISRNQSLIALPPCDPQLAWLLALRAALQIRLAPGFQSYSLTWVRPFQLRALPSVKKLRYGAA